MRNEHSYSYVNLTAATYNDVVPGLLRSRFTFNETHEVTDAQLTADEQALVLGGDLKPLPKEDESDPDMYSVTRLNESPTWADAVAKNFIPKPFVTKDDQGTPTHYLVKLTLSHLAGETSEVLALGQGMNAPDNTLWTKQEAQEYVAQNTPNEL